MRLRDAAPDTDPKPEQGQTSTELGENKGTKVIRREKAFFSTDLREMQRKCREVNAESAGSGLSNAAGRTAVQAVVAVVGGGRGGVGHEGAP